VVRWEGEGPVTEQFVHALIDVYPTNTVIDVALKKNDRSVTSLGGPPIQ
jgi:hypothetical protein